MHLTQEEERALAGEKGLGFQRAMEILVALGRIYEAERLVPISSAHISGVSFKTIGEGGVDFLEEMSIDSKVAVPTTLNPAGMDLERWKDMGVDEDFAQKQKTIIKAYERMGVRTICSCTPYLLGNSPMQGDTVAWAESSAISYVNAVLGARTNREGGPGALAAAIVGKTPLYGLHLEENRKPTVVIESESLKDSSELSLLGYIVGKTFGSAIPYFKGIRPDPDGLKSIAAAMAASGSIAMFYVEGVTPDYQKQEINGLERISLGKDDLKRACDSINTGKEPDLVALGCPHLSQAELRTLASFLDGKRPVRDKPEVWFCTSREIKARCLKEVSILEKFGKVVCDTCMVVTPIEKKYACTATNSTKACVYLPSLCSQKVIFASTKELMRLIL
ncbi:MAG: aconitase X catalytic domain-containing protein [Methanomassiliicoccales archaeon]